MRFIAAALTLFLLQASAPALPSGDSSWINQPVTLQRIENGTDGSESLSEARSFPGFSENLEKFTGALTVQVNNIFLPQINSNRNLNERQRKEIATVALRFLSAMHDEADHLRALHEKLYERVQPNLQENAELIRVEENLSLGSHLVLNWMADILRSLDSHRPYFNVQRKLKAISKITDLSLDNGTVAIPPLELVLRVIRPFKDKGFETAWAYFTKFVIGKTPISESISDKLLDNTLRPGTQFELAPESGIDFSALPDNAIVFTVANHDFAPMDGRAAYEVAKFLNIDRAILLTTEEAYVGVSPSDLRKDPNTVFRQDKFFPKVLQTMRENPNIRVGLTVFAEGTLQYWASQMPRTIKWGAFAYARRAAYEFAGKRPVYIVEVDTNGIEHVTGNQNVNFIAHVKKPIRVPDDPVSDNDPWVVRMRELFERSLNRGRGKMQIDLMQHSHLPRSNVYSVKSVDSLGESLGGARSSGKQINSCAMIFQ